MEANLQCPLDPFVMGQLEDKMNLARVQAIENHVSSGTCIHPPLKHLVLHGDLDGSTPLLVACQEGHLDSVRQIVEVWGADVRAAVNYYHDVPCYHQRPKKKVIGGATPLFVAALQSHVDIVRYLIGKDADVSAITSMKGYYGGTTPLKAAVSARAGYPFVDFMVEKSDIAHLLLEAGANPSALDPSGQPMWPFCGVYTITELIKYGINLDLRDSKGDTILHHWITLASWDLDIIDKEKFFVNGVHLLLDRGVDLNVRDHRGFTPILKSAKSIQLGILELLLDRPEIDATEKIDALKLAGAQLLLTLETGNPEKAIHYWKKALHLREKEKISKIPLQTSGQPVEWETSEQLEDVINNPSVHWIQAMLVGLRIYASQGLEAVVAFLKEFPFMDEDINICCNDEERKPTIAQITDFSLEILRVLLRFDPYEPKLWEYKKDVAKELTYSVLEPYFSTLGKDQPVVNAEFQKIKSTLQLISAGDPRERLAPFQYGYGCFSMLAGVPDLLLHKDIRKYLSASARRHEGALLSEAYYRKDWKTLRFLLHLRADPNAIDPKAFYRKIAWGRYMLLCRAAEEHEHPMVLKGELEREQVSLEMEYTPAHLLFDYGAQPYYNNCEGKTPVDIWIEKNCGEEGMQSPAWQMAPSWCRSTVPKLSCLAAKTIHTEGIPYSRRPGDLPVKLLRFLEKH